ncbi:hypothetical protein T11_5381 [Trichinella zimbabwensis]|uniref:Uncharacterized protein n=1 Tax=Trichinella zimbabwensis TaxID=268475 RepID=A0A0V1GNW7_9BILA|nr:hypothetical protein T11_5381 [Trichinella zimbabwensis]
MIQRLRHYLLKSAFMKRATSSSYSVISREIRNLGMCEQVHS